MGPEKWRFCKEWYWSFGSLLALIADLPIPLDHYGMNLERSTSHFRIWL